MFNVPVSCLVLRHLYIVSFFSSLQSSLSSIFYHLSIYLSSVYLYIYHLFAILYIK